MMIQKGALLHAKSLNTDKAWEVYDYLVDFYFRAKENDLSEPQETKKAGLTAVVSNSDKAPVIQELSIEDKVLAYSQGFIKGVFMAEVFAGRIKVNKLPCTEAKSIEVIYSLLSDVGKRLIMETLFFGGAR